MKKTTAKTIAALVLLALGALTLLLRDQGRLADTAASVIMLVLIAASVSAYFAVERVYRVRERSAAANPG
ncbi:hypothetical protein GY12_00045 [Micrococcus luteus]|nr:hypothetical protein GY12_24965 [Micrococcus luteus]KFC50784.1 hypothetical protein GY12_19325 [Micrococcus luteus]KFC53335.1 hypothetical protein GY12_00045 [Micrococcus luteus]